MASLLGKSFSCQAPSGECLLAKFLRGSRGISKLRGMTDAAGTAASASKPLAGRVVALPETRELDRLAELLETEGARAWRCPLVANQNTPKPRPVDAWLDELLAGRLPAVVFLAGEGG